MVRELRRRLLQALIFAFMSLALCAFATAALALVSLSFSEVYPALVPQAVFSQRPLPV